MDLPSDWIDSAMIRKDLVEPGTRVLICEDEQIVALDIRLHLESFGYEVAGTYIKAEDAIESLRTIPVDLVLMDIRLKGEMDGVQAAQIIRNEFDLPVILLTAYADEETLQRAKQSEPFAYIIKPFEERELRTAAVISIYRHRMEQRLRQRERLLSTVLAKIDNGVIVTEESGRVTYANQIATLLFGLDSNGYSSIDQIFSESVRRSALEGQISVETDVVNGETRNLELVASRVEDGENTVVVWAFQDVTDRLHSAQVLRQKEDQLRHSQRMEAIGRLSGGIAHDFNNLITVVMGYCSLALSDLDANAPPGEVKKNIQGIQESAKRSASLSRQLLSFSRNEAMKPVIVDLNATVQHVESMLRQVLPENMTLQCTLQSSSLMVYIDPARIDQVLLNLVINARDSMKNGGTITLTTERIRVDDEQRTVTGTLPAGTYAVLRISDTGDGIDPEALVHIFEPFFTTKDRESGSGLGLSTAYGIIENSNGAIDVTSTVGHGSRFSVYLPLRTDREATVSPLVAETGPLPGGNEEILVAQEEEALRSLIIGILREQGYTTHSARNVGEGLIMAEHLRRVRLIVSDLSAPYMSAQAIADRYTATPYAPRVLFTIDSNYGALDGAWSLLKPFDRRKLLTVVRTVLDA